MGSLRARLVGILVLVAVLALGCLVVVGQRLMEERSEEQARIDFEAARGQLDRSLALRYEAFRAISDLSYVLPVFRQIATGTDDAADFGLGTEQGDADRTKALHQNLVDADWSWAKQAGSQALIAVGDGKGRLLYSTAAPGNLGQSLMTLSAVKAALEPSDATPTADKRPRDSGAMVINGESPVLIDAGLLPKPGVKGLHVLWARATLLGGQPKALFVQLIRAKDLLADVALAGMGVHMGLVAPDRKREGDVPLLVSYAVDGAMPHVTTPVMHDGRRWLAHRHPLKDIDGASTIGDLIIARDVDTGFKAILAVGDTLLMAAMAALVVALVAGVLFAGRLAKPILAVQRAAKRVAAGELEVHVKPDGPTEIRHLAESFNEMTLGLRERQKLERTFKRYLAPEVVDYLLENPAAQTGGMRRVLTVMFSDVAGFTTFAETRPPEEVVEILNTYLAELAQAISESGGVVDKFIGDNAMGFFGAPIPREDHAARACLAALQQLQGLERIAKLPQAKDWPKLSIRIGIHTGEMIVGNVGGYNTQDYTVVGDAVNLASRIEGANKPYHTELLITEAVVQAAQAHPTTQFRFRELDQIRVVGKQNAVRIYTIEGLADQPSPLPVQCRDRYAQGLVAYRAGEFSQAAALFDQAYAAAPNDGPSQVMADRCRHLAEDPPVQWDGVWTLGSK